MNLAVPRQYIFRIAKSGIVRQGLYASQIALNSIIGFLFARVLAHEFGVSEAKSGFDIAYNIPFIVMTVTGFKFLYSIFASLFARLRADESPQLDDIFSTMLNLLFLTGAASIALGAIFADPITQLLAPGLSPAVQEQTKVLILWMLPLIVTIGAGNYFGAIFTAYSIPIGAEFAFLTCRLGFIIYSLFLTRSYSLTEVAISLFIFSIPTLIFELIVLFKATNLRYRPVLRLKLLELDGIWGQMAGFLFAALISQASHVYLRRLATLDGPSTNAILGYGISLVTPLGMLLGKTLSFGTGPRYVTLHTQGKYNQARRLVFQYIALSLVVTAGLVLLLNANIIPLIELFYGGGNFDAQSVAATAHYTVPLMWSLPGSVLLWVIQIPLANEKNSQAGSAIYTIGYAFQFVLYYLFFPTMGADSLAWGYSLGIIVQALLGLGITIYKVTRPQTVRSPAMS